MPVIKFRDIAKAVPSPASESKADNLRLAFELSELAIKLKRPRAFRGIQRYRSIEASSRLDQVKR